MPQRDSNVNVSLVSMPFGPLFSPSIALGLLKSIALSLECNTKVHYFNLNFAKAVGERFYHDIASGLFPTHNLIGEWIFSSYISDQKSKNNEDFINDIVKPLFKEHIFEGHNRKILFDDFVSQLNAARETAEQFVSDCADQILENAPDIVGITSVFQQNAASIALARAIKRKCQSTYVVMGGANCEGPMGLAIMASSTFVDAVVSGEGEKAFEYILTELKAGRIPIEQANIHTQDQQLNFSVSDFVPSLDRPVQMNELPIPNYSDYFEMLIQLEIDHSFIQLQIPFETSRGCWWGEKHHCTFCGLNGQNMAFRSKSSQRALDELVELTGQYPTKVIGLTDNILDMNYFKDFLPRLEKLDIKAELFYEVKSNLSYDQLTVLYQAGVTYIQPGIESFSDQVLWIMRKGVRAVQNVQLLRDCLLIGITPEWNLLWGFPGENPNEYENMAAMLPSLYHLRPPTTACQLRLDRFSPLFESADILGVVATTPASAYKYVYPYNEDILRQLAYYFDFDYADERNVSSYVNQLAFQTNRWQEEHQSSELVAVDKETMLLIWDTRSSRYKPLTVLEGIKRDIYLYLGKPSSRAKLLGMVESKYHNFINEFLDELIYRRLIVELSNRVLAIAIKLDSYSPKADGLTALVRTIREVSISSSEGENLTVPILEYKSDTPEPANIVIHWDKSYKFD